MEKSVGQHLTWHDPSKGNKQIRAVRAGQRSRVCTEVVVGILQKGARVPQLTQCDGEDSNTQPSMGFLAQAQKPPFKSRVNQFLSTAPILPL